MERLVESKWFKFRYKNIVVSLIMSRTIKKIKDKILDEMYKSGFKSTYSGNLKAIFTNENDVQIKRAIDELGKQGKIKVFGMSSINLDEFLTYFKGYLTDKGILEHENYDFSDNKKWSVEIIRFLQVIEQTDKDVLDLSEIVPEMIKLGSKRSEQILRNFITLSIEYTCNVDKRSAIRLDSYNMIFIYDTFAAITDYGKKVLKQYNQSTIIFQKPYLLKNRDMLIEEHNTLEILIENRLWKDACIKIGSILEYLLTKWLKNKSITSISHLKLKKPKNIDDASFYDKIQFYIENGSKTYSNEIGNITEWNIVNNIIRDYRNYIHLQKYEAKRINYSNPITKNDYDMLYKAYEIISNLFN